MSDPGESDLAARLDELTRELRRQGRAAVAAQAAAESCLEQITALARRDDGGDEDAGDAEDAGADGAAWLSAVLPVADAVDRVAAQAAAMVARRAGGAAPWYWPFRRGAEPDAELCALADGLRVLRAQLDAALEARGVSLDRRVGVPVDPEVHRVVEVRPRRGAERDGVVVEVIRAGVLVNERLVREADVAVTGES